MQRVPEPELMDSPAQTRAYAAADFSEPNGLFCTLTHARLNDTEGHLMDLGCGSGGLLIQLAQTLPQWQMLGVDAGPNMLELARDAIQTAQLDTRVDVLQAHLPSDLDQLQKRMPFDAIVSNSLLHHLEDPMTLWKTISELSSPQTKVVVMDLLRPDSIEEAKKLVEAHTEGADPVLKEDFYNSLLAAWRINEIKEQLETMNWGHWEISQPSNRHWVVTGDFSPHH